MVGNVIDVLAINETRLSNEISSDRVKLPGYDLSVKIEIEMEVSAFMSEIHLVLMNEVT